MFSDPKKNVLEFGFIPGQKVADFGSGTGHYAMALSEVLGPKGRVVAIDLDKDLLVKLKNESLRIGKENIEVINGDIEKKEGTKLRDNYADGVVISNILYQLKNKEAAIAEAVRILRPGGKIYIVEWSDFKLLSGKKLELATKVVSENTTRSLLEKAGLTFERSFSAGESHYGLIGKKPLQ